VRVLSVRSGGGWTILKLINFKPPSHMVISPVSRGAKAVGEMAAVGELAVVGEAGAVAEAADVADATATGSVGVDWGAVARQSVRSISPLEAESEGSVSKSSGPTTSCWHV
jgi:hypothetical protein